MNVTSSGQAHPGAGGLTPESVARYGGGAVGAVGLGVAGHGTFARARTDARRENVQLRVGELDQARTAQAGADAALAADRIHPPAGTTGPQALAWLEGRYAGAAARAITGDGDTRELRVGRFGQPTRAEGQALDAAHAIGDGRSSGVVRAGEWHVPVRLTDSLEPLEKSRQVSYTTVEFGYHYGRNPKNGGAYEYHYGPHEVTRYRTERYLDHFDRFRGAHDGVTALMDGRGRQLEGLATLPERHAARAAESVAEAVDSLSSAERSLRFATGGSRTAQVAGAAAAIVGGAVLAGGIVAAD